MAYTLEKIYLEEKDKFGLRLIAGMKGIRACVDWVHMVETAELVSFLKRKELVITTGVRNMNENELLGFAQALKEKDVSGLIVNIGGYIHAIPKELIDYCDEVGFPLFTLPWEVKLVEFSHDTCKRILYEGQTEASIAEAFLDSMHLPEKRQECMSVLARYGYGADTVFHFFVLKPVGGVPEKFVSVLDDLQYHIEKILNRINGHYISFSQNQMVYAAVADYTEEELELLTKEIKGISLKYDYICYCGINPKTSDLSQLANYYGKSQLLLKLAVSNNLNPCYCDKLSVYKLLMSVDDTEVLFGLCDETLGRLKAYDESNDTALYALLRQYFKNHGCIQNIANENFVHRNTIHYQLNKIEKLLDIDLEDWDDRLRLHLSLLIEEFL